MRRVRVELYSAVGSIILINLVLSGDNALVSSATAAGLPGRRRWLAIVLRVAFTVIATSLLRLPLL